MKKQFLFIFTLLTLIILNGCNYLKNVKVLQGGELRRANFVESIPFEYKKDLIVVKAKLNQDDTLREFIFDTGAFDCKVEHKLAQQLGLPTVAKKSNSTAQGVTREIEVAKIEQLQLGETIFYDIGAGKVVYDEQSASPCIARHGIIGANLIQLAHWKIDYQSQLLYFSDQPFEPTPNQDSFSFSFSKPVLSGTPSFDLKVGEKTVENVLFDVGFNGGLVLPSKFASSFNSDQTQVFYDRSTSGIYGSNLDTLISKRLNIDVGGHTSTIPVEFSSLGKALLGNEYLRHFIVLIDYDSKEITLQAQSEVSIREGASFIPGILNDSLWIVNRSSPQSPYQLGDTLTHINGLKPSEVFNNYCEYVMGIREFLKRTEE